MRKLLFMAILIACSAPLASAQTTDDYDKFNFFAGYSHNRVDTGIDSDEFDFSNADFDDVVNEREGFNGFNVSATGNLSRYVGIKGDYSFHRKSFGDIFENPALCVPGPCPDVRVDVDADLHNFVGGIQIRDNAKETRVKPFAHAMAGVAHARFNVTADDTFSVFDSEQSETGLAGVFGGGIDFRINDRFDFRAVQFDYNPTRLGDQTQHNYRIGIGIVIK